MQLTVRKLRAGFIAFLGGAMLMTMLSGCMTPHTDVSGWWYDQRWADSGGGSE